MTRWILTAATALVLLLPGSSASQESRFTFHEDGTLTDNVTGLMWQREDDGVSREWGDAVAYCQDLDLGGHSDWRLPDVKELKSVVDHSRYSPAIDTEAFPGTKSNTSCYWSSSTHVYYPGYAWAVYFSSGHISRSYKDRDGYGYVRCIR